MLNVIRNLLQKIVNDIDAGNTHIKESEAFEIIDMLRKFSDNSRMSKYAAYRYLNVSRATFDNYVRAGKIPEGKHEIGFKEKFWYKRDLDAFLRNEKEVKKKSKSSHS